ncbi:unnamed protein product, partial [Iphiclides podalirius]
MANPLTLTVYAGANSALRGVAAQTTYLEMQIQVRRIAPYRIAISVNAPRRRPYKARLIRVSALRRENPRLRTEVAILEAKYGMVAL